MSKRIFRSIIMLLLLMGLLITPSFAAAPDSYESGFQIRNLSSTTAAEVDINYYDSSGIVTLSVTDTVDPDSTNTYFPLPDTLPDGFEGSVVISSTEAVASMSNVVGKNTSDTPISYASYSAFFSGNPSVSVPLLMKDNFGYNTSISVQNTGTSPTNITVNYSDGTSNTANNVAASASATFDQTTESHSETVFSATITGSGDAPLAAVVMEVGPDTLFSYGGFGAGSTELVMPLVNENNYGYFTGIQIQNQGGSATEVTVSYTPGEGMPGTACTEKRSIAANSATIFAQNVFTTSTDPSTLISTDCVRGETFVGSGSVTANSASQNLVAVVNQLNIPSKKGAAYMGFNPSTGNGKVVLPLIMDRNWGYFTSWSIANVGLAPITASDLTCLVTGQDKNGSAVSQTYNPTQDIPIGGSWTLVHNGIIADGFVGGATCTGPSGAKLVGAVNQLANSTIDSFLVYEGFSVAP
jgi:hypothetical protein